MSCDRNNILTATLHQEGDGEGRERARERERERGGKRGGKREGKREGTVKQEDSIEGRGKEGRVGKGWIKRKEGRTSVEGEGRKDEK